MGERGLFIIALSALLRLLRFSADVNFKQKIYLWTTLGPRFLSIFLFFSNSTFLKVQNDKLKCNVYLDKVSMNLLPSLLTIQGMLLLNFKFSSRKILLKKFFLKKFKVRSIFIHVWYTFIHICWITNFIFHFLTICLICIRQRHLICIRH